MNNENELYKNKVKQKKNKIELYNDHFENAKRYGIQMTLF